MGRELPNPGTDPGTDDLARADPAAGPTLRRVQLIELEILREFGRRCESESLRWLVIGGTALGAARHEGFIPWDDDIDVAMPRADYERFDALCRRTTDDRFGWQSPSTDRAYPFIYGKLFRRNTVAIEAATAHLPMQHSIAIDVFPLDGAPGSRIGGRLHALAFKLAATTIGARIRRTGIRQLGGAAFRAIPRSWALGLIDFLAGRYPFDDSPRAVNAGGAWGYARECQPRDRFQPTSLRAFEGTPVPVPGQLDAYLTQLYGDYMQLPPPDQRRPRHNAAILGLDDSAGTGEPAQDPFPSPGAESRTRRTAVVWLGILVVRVGFLLGRLRPLRSHVVIAVGQSGRVDGNLLYIRRELERRTPPIPVRVISYTVRPGLRGRLAGARDALRAGYHLATARLFVVDDFFFPMYVITPRPGTVRVQTWHGSGAFKKVGYSVLDKSFGVDQSLVNVVAIHSNYDLVLMPSSAATDSYMDAFHLPRDRFTSALGIPRVDLFHDRAHRARAIDEIHRRYALPGDRKVLLYAPTFRGDEVRAARYQDDLDLGIMREALAGRWVVLLRLHPFVRRSVTIGPDLADFAIDVSDWPDINELMLVADLLVTDYSSAIFEFALLGRPMAFLAPDYDAYERERGFYFDYRTGVPGPIFETTAELAAYVAVGSFDADRAVAFAKASFDIADGHASERFVDRVAIPALRGELVRVEVEPRLEDRVIAPLSRDKG